MVLPSWRVATHAPECGGSAGWASSGWPLWRGVPAHWRGGGLQGRRVGRPWVQQSKEYGHTGAAAAGGGRWSRQGGRQLRRHQASARLQRHSNPLTRHAGGRRRCRLQGGARGLLRSLALPLLLLLTACLLLLRLLPLLASGAVLLRLLRLLPACLFRPPLPPLPSSRLLIFLHGLMPRHGNIVLNVGAPGHGCCCPLPHVCQVVLQACDLLEQPGFPLHMSLPLGLRARFRGGERGEGQGLGGGRGVHPEGAGGRGLGGGAGACKGRGQGASPKESVKGQGGGQQRHGAELAAARTDSAARSS